MREILLQKGNYGGETLGRGGTHRRAVERMGANGLRFS